jgi:hypothetical protein
VGEWSVRNGFRRFPRLLNTTFCQWSRIVTLDNSKAISLCFAMPHEPNLKSLNKHGGNWQDQLPDLN